MFDLIITVSPQISGRELKHFVNNGATIFRLNGSFLSLKEIKREIGRIRNCVGRQAKLLLDLPGFKIRFANLTNTLSYVKGKPFKLNKSVFNYPEFMELIGVGTVLRINDGMDTLVVQKKTEKTLELASDKDGVIRIGKGLHIDGTSYRPSSNSLSKRDCDLIEIAKKYGVEYVGLSFVYSLEDLEHVQKLLNTSSTKCIPKIESKESLKDLWRILKNSEKIIIDRGDMAGEIGLKNIWMSQRCVIAMAKMTNTEVIIATQVLSSMVKRSIPSIAEVDSLYSLLNRGISGIQFSEETAVGEYAERAVSFAKAFLDDYRVVKQEKNRDKRVVVWLLGPTSSGKTTIAKALKERFIHLGVGVDHYDGDEFRNLFGNGFGFSKEDRQKVVASIVHFANRSVSNGSNAIVSALTAHEEARKYIDENVKGMVKVFVKCSVKKCMQRDPKGLYKLAKDGKINTLIGYNSDYKPPKMPNLVVDTENASVSQCADSILEYLVEKGLLTY